MLDDNAYAWQSFQRRIGDVALPDTDEVVIKRKSKDNQGNLPRTCWVARIQPPTALAPKIHTGCAHLLGLSEITTYKKLRRGLPCLKKCLLAAATLSLIICLPLADSWGDGVRIGFRRRWSRVRRRVTFSSSSG